MHPTTIRLRFQRLEIPNLNGRTCAFREMLLQAPPSVVAGMLGYGTNRAEALAAEAGPPGSTTPLVTTRVIESRTPAPDVAWGAGWPNFSVLGSSTHARHPSGQRYWPMSRPTNPSPAGTRPRRSPTASTDGTRICWVTKGRGQPLLLVHGGGADHSRLEPFAELPADRFIVHLVDRRGRGMSGDQSTYDIELEYDDIAAVAEAIGQEVTVLGHSYGGPIVIGAAAPMPSPA